MNIAINGFGRIGRAVFQSRVWPAQIKIVGINDLTDTKFLGASLQHDTAYHKWEHEVKYDEKI